MKKTDLIKAVGIIDAQLAEVENDITTVETDITALYDGFDNVKTQEQVEEYDRKYRLFSKRKTLYLEAAYSLRTAHLGLNHIINEACTPEIDLN